MTRVSNVHFLVLALRTETLVQQNRILQREIFKLQLETRKYMDSVMANPENKHNPNN